MRSRSFGLRMGSGRTRRWRRISASLRSRCGRGFARSRPERCPDAVTRAGAGDELIRLRAENARLLKAEQEWRLEREILRRAAAYFAREMK